MVPACAAGETPRGLWEALCRYKGPGRVHGTSHKSRREGVVGHGRAARVLLEAALATSPPVRGSPQPAGPPPPRFILDVCRRVATWQGGSSPPSHPLQAALKLEPCPPGWPPPHPIPLPSDSPQGPLLGCCSPFSSCPAHPVACLPSPAASPLLAMARGPPPHQNCPLSALASAPPAPRLWLCGHSRPSTGQHPSSAPSPLSQIEQHSAHALGDSRDSRVESAQFMLETSLGMVEDVGWRG